MNQPTATNRPVWANEEQTATYIAFEGTWQAEAFTKAAYYLRELLNEANSEVATIVDVIHPRPISMDALRAAHDFFQGDHPNFGRVFVVVPEPMLPGIEEVVRRSFGGKLPAHMQFVPTVQDAERAVQGTSPV